MKQLTLLISLLLLVVADLNAQQKFAQKRFLQSHYTEQFLLENLIEGDEWVPYPDYSDRKGWSEKLGELRDTIITRGESLLDYEWKAIKATDFLDYERVGAKQMCDAYFDNRTALNYLVMAELAEGEGRFLDQILNGAWLFCEMTSWSIAAHIRMSQQDSDSVLPIFDRQGIEIAGGDVAATMAWTYHFFKGEFDKISPSIARRIKENITTRIFEDYQAREDYWWMALDENITVVNNWNVWINSNVMLAYLLVEDDMDHRAKGLHKVIRSTDRFIDFVHDDGACEEGPTYWDRAGGKLYDCLQILDMATLEKAPYWGDRLVRNLGEYISKSYIGDGYVVNFADASPRGGGNSHLIYRYGKAIGSSEMMGFAAYLYERGGKKVELGPYNDLFRCLETVTLQSELAAVEPELSSESFFWYDQTEFCYARAGDAFLASKGGFNEESHNHNDAGAFIYYLDQKPLIVDIGAGTYTNKTFSEERYSIFTMRSSYHNLPIINGTEQKNGYDYRATNVSVDPKKRMSSYDIAAAYGDDAKVDSWVRSYSLSDKGVVTIRDKFSLKEAIEPSKIVFISAVKPVVESGSILLDNSGTCARLTFDKGQFTVGVETIDLDDEKLVKSWGKTLYRVVLEAKDLKQSGEYRYCIEPH